MIVRTRTTLMVEKSDEVSAELVQSDGKRCFPSDRFLLIPGDELSLNPYGTDERGILEVDLRSLPSSEHRAAYLRLGKELTTIDDEYAVQKRLF